MSDFLPQSNISSGQAHQPASPDVQAQGMDIPTGTVSHLRAIFEQRIAGHQYERDEVYIERTVEAVVMLARENTTYAERLLNIELLTLIHLPEELILFLRNHDNLYRAFLRSRKRAREARDGGMDLNGLTGVSHRIVHLRYYFVWGFLQEEMSYRAIADHMRQDPAVKEEFTDLAVILEEQMTTALTRLDTLTRELNHDVELENVGPDHDVNDFGQAVPSHRMRLRGKEEIADTNDHSISCCICLETYNGSTHTAFRLNACNHIIGKPCMQAWLNGTSTNSTLCPHCRALICTRRPRRPVISVGRPELEEEYSMVKALIQRIVVLIEEVDIVHFDVYSQGDERNLEVEDIVTREGGLMNVLMGEVNGTLAANGINFTFVSNNVGRVRRWRLRQTDLAVDMTDV